MLSSEPPGRFLGSYSIGAVFFQHRTAPQGARAPHTPLHPALARGGGAGRVHVQVHVRAPNEVHSGWRAAADAGGEVRFSRAPLACVDSGATPASCGGMDRRGCCAARLWRTPSTLPSTPERCAQLSLAMPRPSPTTVPLDTYPPRAAAILESPRLHGVRQLGSMQTVYAVLPCPQVM